MNTDQQSVEDTNTTTPADTVETAAPPRARLIQLDRDTVEPTPS